MVLPALGIFPRAATTDAWPAPQPCMKNATMGSPPSLCVFSVRPVSPSLESYGQRLLHDTECNAAHCKKLLGLSLLNVGTVCCWPHASPWNALSFPNSWRIALLVIRSPNLGKNTTTERRLKGGTGGGDPGYKNVQVLQDHCEVFLAPWRGLVLVTACFCMLCRACVCHVCTPWRLEVHFACLQSIATLFMESGVSC